MLPSTNTGILSARIAATPRSVESSCNLSVTMACKRVWQRHRQQKNDGQRNEDAGRPTAADDDCQTEQRDDQTRLFDKVRFAQYPEKPTNLSSNDEGNPWPPAFVRQRANEAPLPPRNESHKRRR